MSNINIIEDIRKEQERIPSMEHVYSKGLMMPLVSSNSGSRRIMYATQTEHMLMLMDAEPALFQTGYENAFGEHSSSFEIADQDYNVIAKIPKFSFNPEHHYYLIVKSDNGEYGVIERISYKHITESYGFLYNNKKLDSKKVGDRIKQGDVVHKSLAFDEANNRQDGTNLITTYLACEHTKEDGIIISEAAAKKLTSPLVKKVTIIINDNDIPLNIYGNNDLYKSFPDIGEDISNGLLCALRREKKEEMLFAQSYQRLQQTMISDVKYPLKGKVIDVNIYCNNPEALTKYHYFNQLRFYDNEQKKFLSNFVEVVKPIIESGAKCSYELQKLYFNSVKILEGGQYIKDRAFSNTILEIVVLDESIVRVGDKISNRYGGKGVISQIRPQEMMPQLDNGQYVDVIFNSSTCVNRENAGQLFETSINHISSKLVDHFNSGVFHTDEMLEMIIEYMRYVVPEQANYLSIYLQTLSPDEQEILLDSLINDKGLIISMKPTSEAIDLDKLNAIYQAFPFIGQYNVSVPQRDSNGNIRYINTRRKLVCGKQYIYRLKQYAEEKFSAVSLSATNIRNENSRNSNKKAYKTIHSKTCVKFGEMETGDLIHLDPEIVVINLLLHSLSPKGRRLSEELLTGDPFNVDIKLDEDSSNRAVEILNAYLLTMGLEFRFHKVPKILKPLFSNVREVGDLKPLFREINELEVYDPTYNEMMIDFRHAQRESGNKPLFTKHLFREEY